MELPNNGVEECNTGAPRPVPPEAVREALERILSNHAFARAERPRKFLKFVVESTLEGDAGTLTEYRLATEVFGRPPSFDPASDSIVRAEAGRLRRKLQDYYRNEGRADSVVISLPPRTYVPGFHLLAGEIAPGAPPQPSPVRSLRWKLYALALAGAVLAGALATWAAWKLFLEEAAPAAAAARTIAVLPFADLSPGHDQAFFCDGLTEELGAALANVEGLQVVGRATVSRFRSNTDDLREIGRKLHVGLVLEGSVRKRERGWRVTVELANALTGYRVWSRSYDREAADAIAVQQEIAHGVAAVLKAELTSGRLATRPSTSVEAYDLYLKGLHAAHDWNTEALLEAVRAFEAAAAKDPTFAPAHSALAEHYALLGLNAVLPPKEVMPKAKAAALRALGLDPSHARAHASLGLVQAVYEWDWAAAERNFQSAYDESGGAGAEERQMKAFGYLVPRGRLEEALAEIRHVQSENPLSPQIDSHLGMFCYYQRRYDLAIERFRRVLKWDPEFEAAYRGRPAPEQTARLAQALAAIRDGNGAADLTHAGALMGDRREAERVIGELVRLSAKRYVSPVYIAAFYAGVGDKDRTLEWLEKAYVARAPALVFLKVDPRYEFLRSDPRFASLLQRLHFN